MSALTNEGLKRIEINLPVDGNGNPDITEQERIVALLEEVEELKNRRTKANARVSELTPALFVKLFGSPSDWKSKWDVASFGGVSAFITSGSRGWAAYYADSGARFIRVQNLAGHQLNFDDAVFVSPPDSAEAHRTRIQPNDLLLAITGNTIGLSAMAPSNIGESYVSQHVAIIRPNERINPNYFAAFVALSNGAQQQIREIQYGQTKPGLEKDRGWIGAESSGRRQR